MRLTYRGKEKDKAYCDYDTRDIINRLAEYEDIGTVEEFKELKEKATAKKPILYPFSKCPSCNYTLPYALVNYCSNCGTALDCSEGKE